MNNQFDPIYLEQQQTGKILVNKEDKRIARRKTGKTLVNKVITTSKGHKYKNNNTIQEQNSGRSIKTQKCAL